MNLLYSRIKALCEEQGASIGNLCQDVGISRGNLTDLKMGRSTGLSAGALTKIARYLGTSVDYLLTGETPEDLAGAYDAKTGRPVYLDDEAIDYLRELKTRPEAKMLFSLAKNASKEEIEAIVRMVETMKEGQEGGGL